MDQIFIHGLTFETIVGVLAEERTTPQPLRVDLTIDTDTTAAARSRDLADTVDYAAIAETVVTFCRTEEAGLLETLAEGIAELVLARGVAGVRVRLAKPRAVAAADAVGVDIYRRRS